MKIGDTFERDYPFVWHKPWTDKILDRHYSGWWSMGCYKEIEEYGNGYGKAFYTANGIGSIIFEVLAVVEMPRNYKNRVIYKFDRIDPDGKRENSSKTFTVTESVFKQMIKVPYPHEYEVENENN